MFAFLVGNSLFLVGKGRILCGRYRFVGPRPKGCCAGFLKKMLLVDGEKRTFVGLKR